jgi:hypothetical protein
MEFRLRTTNHRAPRFAEVAEFLDGKGRRPSKAAEPLVQDAPEDAAGATLSSGGNSVQRVSHSPSCVASWPRRVEGILERRARPTPKVCPDRLSPSTYSVVLLFSTLIDRLAHPARACRGMTRSGGFFFLGGA